MFIARQPIFDIEMNVYGYELLFRQESQSQVFDGVSSQGATASVVLGLYESGLDSIVENKMAFINFDEKFIQSEALELIEPERMVVELLENIQIDRLLLDRIESVKKKGYRIALDDFEKDYKEYPLSPYADIIKYDLLQTRLDTIVDEVLLALEQGKTLLAEKVETQEEFNKAKAMGFKLFQGYFFSKPQIAARSCSKSPTKLQYFRMLSELKKEEPSFEKLAELIKLDVTLTYRILRMVGTRSKEKTAKSIRDSLAYMGFDEIERWLSTMMVLDLGNDKPRELMRLSIIRSRFAEAIARLAKMPIAYQHYASMMGLFSCLDGILDQTMEEALADMLIPDVIREALVEKAGNLYPIYKLLLAYENGEWVDVEIATEHLGIDGQILYEDYRTSIEWARNMLRMIA